MEDDLSDRQPSHTYAADAITMIDTEKDSSQAYSVESHQTSQPSDTTDISDDSPYNLDTSISQGTGDVSHEFDSAEGSTEETLTEAVTLSQSYLFRQGVGVTKCINSGLFELGILDKIPFPVPSYTILYELLCDQSKSFQDLMTKMWHRPPGKLFL